MVSIWDKRDSTNQFACMFKAILYYRHFVWAMAFVGFDVQIKTDLMITVDSTLSCDSFFHSIHQIQIEIVTMFRGNSAHQHQHQHNRFSLWRSTIVICCLFVVYSYFCPYSCSRSVTALAAIFKRYECKLDKPLNPFIQIKTFLLLNCATNNWYESSFIFCELNLILASAIIQQLTLQKFLSSLVAFFFCSLLLSLLLLLSALRDGGLGAIETMKCALYAPQSTYFAHGSNLLW